jgi:catechol 2,3-dioxygenase-like lactoylglutathione lyase family enzyme
MSKALDWDGILTCPMEAKDMEASIKWYEDVLGFELMYRVDEIGWCEMKTPVANVHLGLSQVEAPKVEGGATLTFGVKDVEAAKAHVEGHDVRTDGDIVTYPGMVKLLTFYDPDGNKLMFAQDISE